MPKIPCSELQKTMSDLAMLYAAQGKKNLAEVVEAMQNDVNPALTREIVADAIRAATTGKSAVVSEVAKAVNTVRQEARTDAALREKIAAANRSLAAGAVPTPQQRLSRPVTEPVRALRELRDELTRQIRQSDPAKAKRLQESIDRLSQQIDRLDSGEYAPPEPKAFRPGSRRLQRLEYERDRLRNDVRRRIERLKPRTMMQRAIGVAGEIATAPRAIVTSFDLGLSGVYRQAGFLNLGDPVQAAKQTAVSVRSSLSKAEAHRIDTELRSSEAAALFDRAGGYLAPTELHRGGGREEAYLSTWADYIPGVGSSARGYVNGLNWVRLEKFQNMSRGLAMNGEPTMAEAKVLANFINAATGRGKLGIENTKISLEHSAETLSQIFFSPRLWTSRIQLVTGQPLWGGEWKGSWRARKAVAKEYGRFLVGLGSFYGLAAAAGGTIGLDPRKHDFGSVKFGNTYIDPLAGIKKHTVFGARMASGESVSVTGRPRELTSDDKARAALGYVRGHLAPVPSTLVDSWLGKDILGREVTFVGEVSDMVMPMHFRDIYEAMREEGVPEGAAMGLLGVFGMGVKTIPEDEGVRR